MLLTRGNYYQWYLESKLYHSSRADWLWMQDDRAALPEDVRMDNVVISAAKPEIPEVKDADGNIIQQHQEAIPQIMMQGGIVEKGTLAVPAFRSFRTRIMENNTLTPDEKFEKDGQGKTGMQLD